MTGYVWVFLVLGKGSKSASLLLFFFFRMALMHPLYNCLPIIPVLVSSLCSQCPTNPQQRCLPSFCSLLGCLHEHPSFNKQPHTGPPGSLLAPHLQLSWPTLLSPRKTNSDSSQDGKDQLVLTSRYAPIVSPPSLPQSFCFPVFLTGLSIKQMLRKHLRSACGIHRMRWRLSDLPEVKQQEWVLCQLPRASFPFHTPLISAKSSRMTWTL